MSDGSGGIIALYEDNRDGAYDIYAQRVVSTGAIASGWPVGGRQLCGAAGNRWYLVACSDGDGGAIAVWNDRRNNSEDIYAMRVQANGHTAGGWANDGEFVGSGNSIGDIIADGSGGAIVSWGGASGSNVYVQKLTSSGSLSWDPEGVPVSEATLDQTYSVMVPDGSGGAYVPGRTADIRPTPPSPITCLPPERPTLAGPLTGVGSATALFPTTALRWSPTAGGVIWGDRDNDLFGLSMSSTWTPPYGLLLSAQPASAGSVTSSPVLPSLD